MSAWGKRIDDRWDTWKGLDDMTDADIDRRDRRALSNVLQFAVVATLSVVLIVLLTSVMG